MHIDAWTCVCLSVGIVHAHTCTVVKEQVPGMGVCAHLCAVNVSACVLWGSCACKSQRQQLAECVMTCL